MEFGQMLDQIMSPVTLALLIAAAVVFLIVVAKAPEFLVAILLIGPSYIQWAFALMNLQIERRTFAVAGAFVFVPAVLLVAIMRLTQASEREPVIGRPNFPYIIATVFMGLVLLLGLIWTQAPVYGDQKTREYFVFGMAPMLLAFVLIRDVASVRRLLWWVLGMTTLTVVLTSAYVLATRGTLFTMIMVHGEGEVGSMAGTLRGHGALSTPLLLTMGALFAMAGGRRSVWWKVAPVLLFPLIGFFTVMAGTRSNLTGFAGVSLAGSFLAYRKHVGVLLIVVLVLVSAGLVVYASAPQSVSERMFSNWFDEGEGGTIRITMFKTCLAGFFDSPIIGQGTGGWPTYAFGIDAYDYPHNMFGEMLLEGGLLGFIPFLLIWGFIVGRIIRILRTYPVGTEIYGLAIFGAGLVMMELANGLGHFGLAHHSCTLLMSGAVVLRSTFVVEHAQAQEEPVADAETPLRAVLTDT